MSYEWVHHKPLTRIGGEDIEPGEVFEPTEAEKRSFADAIKTVNNKSKEPNPAEASAESDSESGSEDTPLSEKDYSELRDMAVEADTDEINGRSSKDEIVSYFEDN